jgi:hypothetical protein
MRRREFIALFGGALAWPKPDICGAANCTYSITSSAVI